jgi:poly(3-hydroxybutyrate) depolymerase
MKRGAASDDAGPGATGLADAFPFDSFSSGRAKTSGKSKPVRTIVFHGRQDRTVHPLNGRQVVAEALARFPQDELVARQEAGRSPGGRSYTRTIHVDSDGKPMVEQWEVQGAGHAWSGGSASGSYTDPIGPDASAAMVEFFFSR